MGLEYFHAAEDTQNTRNEVFDIIEKNLAGVAVDALLPHQTEDGWDRLVAVNLTGAMHCARAAAGPLSKAGRGHIVNIGSYAGLAGGRGQSAYAATKAGLIGLTSALASELAASDIRVNAVLPGVLPTPMTAQLHPEVLQHLQKANRLNRLNSISEVARFVVFLTGMENVSGQVFQLDSRPARWT